MGRRIDAANKWLWRERIWENVFTEVVGNLIAVSIAGTFLIVIGAIEVSATAWVNIFTVMLVLATFLLFVWAVGNYPRWVRQHHRWRWLTRAGVLIVSVVWIVSGYHGFRRLDAQTGLPAAFREASLSFWDSYTSLYETLRSLWPF